MSTVTLTTRRVLRKADLREANERLILNLIRQTPDISRSDLVRVTGFSASSVSLIVNRLIRRGWVHEERLESNAQTGRPPVALRLNANSMLAIGVEISREITRIAVADLDGRILRQKPLPWHSSASVFLGRLRSVIHAEISACGEGKVLGVGVALPGTIRRDTGRVTAAESLGWFDIDVGGELSRRSKVPFYYDNNAKLAAMAERWYRKPGSPEIKDYVFITAQGGLGTGVVIDGRILHGADGEASEFGHTLLYANGRKCICGNTGCWEEYASDRALVRIYAEKAPGEASRVLPSAEEIVQLARSGNEPALAALAEVARNLSLGFVNLIYALNPEAIIVGDCLGKAWDLIEPEVWVACGSAFRNVISAGSPLRRNISSATLF
ncbi:MAG: ROK family transcriptional regulator [Bryobacterales bacterium]|nr:ROK family transcriptional regulator [Bryobacterales bacterium]